MNYNVPTPPTECPWGLISSILPPNIDWCENYVCGWFHEPANTWSNVAFFIAAIVLKLRLKNQSNALKLFTPFMFLMGLFSFVYHASYNFPSQFMDFVGMFFFIGNMLVFNLSRAKIIQKKGRHVLRWTITGILSATVIVLYFIQVPYQPLVGVLALGVLITEWHARSKEDLPANYAYLAIGGAFMAIAATFTYLDHSRLWCNPDDHIWQGHALWHVFSAMGLTCIVLYYRQFDDNTD